jgi:Tol biopolymer transport system component
MTRSRLVRGGALAALLLAARLLATAAGAGAAPTWWVLYAAGGDLWEANGKDEPIQLTHDGHLGQPAWGSDALAYVRRDGNASDVWLATAGDGPRAVTRNASPVVAENHWAAQPVVAPDATHLVMLSDRDKASTGVGDLALWDLDLRRMVARQLTHPQEYTGGDQDPALDPLDDRRMIFTRYRYDQNQLVEELDWLDLAVGQALPLTPPDQPSRQAAFAPDAGSVAFVQTTGGASEDLFVAQLDAGGDRPRLVDPRRVASGVIAQPVWRPDGAALAYLALVERRFQLWTLPVERGPDGDAHFGPPRQFGTVTGLDPASRPVWLTEDQATAVRDWLARLPQS